VPVSWSALSSRCEAVGDTGFLNGPAMTNSIFGAEVSVKLVLDLSTCTVPWCGRKQGLTGTVV
jgi:hypothetical protein